MGPKHWSQLLPKTKLDLNAFKNVYFNCAEEEEPAVFKKFWGDIGSDCDGFKKTCPTWSLWKIEYTPAPGSNECKDILKTQNLLGMFTQKVGSFGKHMFGTMGVYGKQGACLVRGIWLIRGENPNPPELTAIASWEFYKKTRLDPVKDRAMVLEYWTKVQA